MLILKGHGYGEAVRTVAFAPDGRSLASAGNEGKVRVWDLATGESIVAPKSTSYVCSLAYDPDGHYLAWGEWGQEVVIWEPGAPAARLLKLTKSYQQPRMHVAYAPDGCFLAAVSGTVWLLETSTWESLPLSEGSANGSGSVAFAPDGKTFASGHSRRGYRVTEHTVRLWDVGKRRVVGTLVGHGTAAQAMAFSPDTRLLASACGPELFVWDTTTREVVLRHAMDRMYFKDVAFTPDGRFLLLARNDETVRVWRTSDWGEQRTYRWELGKMVSLAIDPAGMRAAAGSDKGKIVVWDLDL